MPGDQNTVFTHDSSFEFVHDIQPLTIGDVIQLFCYMRENERELAVNSESGITGGLSLFILR